ncbi:hypothetical protein TCSYLVIO_004615 [Trypanosoma cruzi]|nr:hypothetical protein TCSYLVIO_004615 [Trypanosoma cruzi]
MGCIPFYFYLFFGFFQLFHILQKKEQMDRGDFEFAPDPITEAFDSTLETLNNVPLRVLSNVPIEELPPTVVPSGQQRPIREMMRGGRRIRRSRLHRTKADVSGEPAPGTFATSPTDAAEGGEPTSSPKNSFAGHKRNRFDWSEEELRDFYKFLSQYGTDFNAIAVMYIGRSRKDVKRLYHRELRKRSEDVRAALSSREEIDLGAFRAQLKKREELQQVPVRQLEQEEEEALRLIEAGALQFQSTSNDGETPAGGSGNKDFEFDFAAVKNMTAEEIQPINNAKTADGVNCDDSEDNLNKNTSLFSKCAESSGVRNNEFGTLMDEKLMDDLMELDKPLEDDFF